MKDDLYYVRRPFPLYAGIPADHGAVFPLGGHPNDEKLIRLGFLEKVDGKPFFAQCGVCHTRFLSGKLRDAHGDLRHNPRQDLDALVVADTASMLEGLPHYSQTGIEGAIVPDLTGDADERRWERDAPIHWEKTAASQKG